MNKTLLAILLAQLICGNTFAINIAGTSAYFDQKDLEEVISRLSSQQLFELDNMSLSDSQCEYEILEEVYQLDKDSSLKDSLIYLRSNKTIDDTEYRLLNRTIKSFLKSKKDKYLSPFKSKVEDFNKNAFHDFSKQIEGGLCLNIAFKNLIGALKVEKPIKSFKVAYHKGLISKRMYWQLKRLVQEDYHKEANTLSEYRKNQNFLTNQFPERLEIEGVDYISKRSEKRKASRREVLLSKYNPFQIIYLRSMMERLLNRINADFVSINVVLDDEVVEEIILDPLEQYRFAAKMIRKELGDLQNTNLFSSTNVSFEDILAASFETGLVNGEDLSTLETVEYVWNPKLTKGEKRKRFIKRYGTIFVAAIPASVYFVKVFALVGIEMLTDIKKEPARDHSMF
ncbi:hypothetical protein [Halobacteriovorax sp. YZS-1-1]|uniref:hypothetical protein n=1 Tax=unclassified Halobacteriovorax TaxID=2639665 RepID=UPI003999E78E